MRSQRFSKSVSQCSILSSQSQPKEEKVKTELERSGNCLHCRLSLSASQTTLTRSGLSPSTSLLRSSSRCSPYSHLSKSQSRMIRLLSSSARVYSGLRRQSLKASTPVKINSFSKEPQKQKSNPYRLRSRRLKGKVNGKRSNFLRAAIPATRLLSRSQ